MKKLANQLWKTIASGWVFIIFFFASILHTARFIQVDLVAVLLLALAGVPLILPLISKHVRKIKAGKEGFEAEMQENREGLPAEVVEQKSVTRDEANRNIESFFNFSIHARRILKTLWHYQNQTFGIDSDKRWGFRAIPGGVVA